MKKIAPSLLSADFSKLGEEAAIVTAHGADLLHIDVMDGHFVPNISYGAAVMKSLNKLNTAPYDVHLMIEDPDKYFPDFVTEKTEYIVIHAESTKHLNRTITSIKEKGIKAGIALNPATSLSVLDYLLEYVDLVLIMSVNPGFGGQSFIPSSIEKIRELSEIRERRGLSFAIEVDGGVTLENAKALTEAGADILVAGSSVFKADDIGKRVEDFIRTIR